MGINIEPVVLCILDGWGIGRDGPYNAIKNANPKFFNSLLKTCPWSKLQTSSGHVGLPRGQMGNSEVGHATIGAGRIIEQDLPRINEAIKSGKIFENKTLCFIKRNCHIIGLASDGGVHSHIKHIIALSKFLAERGVNVKLHLIMDGRDTPPKSAMTFITQIEKKLLNVYSNASIATISGRYYAMDRDNRYERTEAAYRVIIAGASGSNGFVNARDVIAESYADNATDEFIKPQAAKNYSRILEGDFVICANFRSDRMRQLSEALFAPEFNKFERPSIKLGTKIVMTSYSEAIDKWASVLFPSIEIERSLSEILSRRNISQLRIAETEKYPHITFFFNSGRETPYPLEKRILIDSPRVSTYDMQPEMSAYEITSRLEKEILSNQSQFLLANFANADMVGHTGNYVATLKAIEILDSCLNRLFDATMKVNGTLVITADHGNAENMLDHATNCPNTAHTTNPVPFIVAGERYAKGKVRIRNGTLADVAPTILSMYGIPAPEQMTGHNLIEEKRGKL